MHSEEVESCRRGVDCTQRVVSGNGTVSKVTYVVWNHFGGN
jgi:hypothetical protein